MVEITLVPFGYLHSIVPSLTPFFQRSEFWTNGRASIDDIIQFLYTGEMHLWVAYEDDFDNIVGCMITELKQYPKSKMFVVQYLSGDYGVLAEMGDTVFPLIENAARDAGCSGIEFFGRPGWGAHVKPYGYNVQTVVYEKHFKDDEV